MQRQFGCFMIPLDQDKLRNMNVSKLFVALLALGLTLATFAAVIYFFSETFILLEGLSASSKSLLLAVLPVLSSVPLGAAALVRSRRGKES
jgi:hypothetical protein